MQNLGRHAAGFDEAFEEKVLALFLEELSDAAIARVLNVGRATEIACGVGGGGGGGGGVAAAWCGVAPAFCLSGEWAQREMVCLAVLSTGSGDRRYQWG